MHANGQEKVRQAVKSMKKPWYPFSIIIAIVIWIVCMLPIPENPLSDVRFIDKWTHFAMYSTFTAVIWVEYALRHDAVMWRRLITFGLLLPVLMGIAVELAQAYLTTCRSGDWLDAVCNACGVLIGAGIGLVVIRRRYR